MEKSTEISELSKGFLAVYYKFKSEKNFNDLIQVYQNDSTLTQNGEIYTGKEQIKAKFDSVLNQNYKYQIKFQDFQPGPINDSLFIVIQGLATLNEQSPLPFYQAFTVILKQGSIMKIHNDIFRIIQ